MSLQRRQQFFRAWYRDQRRYSMSSEEWLYIGQLLLASILAFGLGLAIGLLVWF